MNREQALELRRVIYLCILAETEFDLEETSQQVDTLIEMHTTQGENDDIVNQSITLNDMCWNGLM